MCVLYVTFAILAVILPPSSQRTTQRTQKNSLNIYVFSEIVYNFVVSSKTQGYGNNDRHSTRQFAAPHRPHRRRRVTTIRNAENKYKRLNTKKRRYENKEKSSFSLYYNYSLSYIFNNHYFRNIKKQLYKCIYKKYMCRQNRRYYKRNKIYINNRFYMKTLIPLYITVKYFFIILFYHHCIFIHFI